MRVTAAMTPGNMDLTCVYHDFTRNPIDPTESIANQLAESRIERKMDDLVSRNETKEKRIHILHLILN